jgi:hypothetical protein
VDAFADCLKHRTDLVLVLVGCISGLDNAAELRTDQAPSLEGNLSVEL